LQIKISARHGHLNDATRGFIEEKASKLLHIFERLTMIEVTVDTSNHQANVEVLVSAEHKHDFVAHETHPELMTAVEGAIAKLEQQLRRYKEKVQKGHRRDRKPGERGTEEPTTPTEADEQGVE
jgi:putative sigma-54 modulation protein